MDTTGKPARRLWADALAILVGLSLFGMAIWPGNRSASNEVARELGNASVLWGVHAAAGALALLGVLIAQRWRSRALGRALVILGGVALIGVFLFFRDFSTRAWLAVLLPGLLLLLSGPAVGPMPGPAEVPLKKA